MAWEQAYREGATMLNVDDKVKEIKQRTYKSHRVLHAEVGAGPRARKAPFKATSKQRWGAAGAGVGTKLVPTPEQANWPAKRQLMLDTDDNTVHRITHVGWHDEQKCVVAWFYEMEGVDTPMPKVGGKKLDQDECAICNIADATEMINDYENALAAGTLPFVPN